MGYAKGVSHGFLPVVVIVLWSMQVHAMPPSISQLERRVELTALLLLLTPSSSSTATIMTTLAPAAQKVSLVT
jgi:hypothetical protein